MLEINVATAESYLRERSLVGQQERIEVSELTGGVSNVVLLIERSDRANFVLKQARPQLRVPQPWFCSIERIWREVDVLQICQQVLTVPSTSSDKASGPVIRTPDVLFVDRENYLFTMTAAPRHEVWKAQLLSGRTDDAIAQGCGRLMAMLHAETWGNETIAKQIGDRQFFDDLRVDPYYRQIARQDDGLRPAVDQLIQSLESHPRCLVHGDFSPKNLLVFDGGLMLVDFEVGHYGDPAFDLGFFLSHLVLKAVRAAPEFDPYLQLIDSFWTEYAQCFCAGAGSGEFAELTARGIQNLAGCLLARIDGKSTVDYLADEARRHAVRRLGRELFAARPARWNDLMTTIHAHLAQVAG